MIQTGFTKERHPINNVRQSQAVFPERTIGSVVFFYLPGNANARRFEQSESGGFNKTGLLSGQRKFGTGVFAIRLAKCSFDCCNRLLLGYTTST
jgi:hypothetical protein